MLDDRDYMRPAENTFRDSITFYLTAAIVLGFILQCLVLLVSKADLANLFVLRREEFFSGQVWRLVSFQFVHDCPWPFHVLFNALGLYFTGRTIEAVFGARPLLQLFFWGGTLGGLVHLATTYLPGQSHTSVIGASGGVLALLAAYCVLHPRHEVCFIVLIFPVNLRADIVLWFMLGLSAFGIIVFPFGGISGAAHLGGLLFGIGYARRALGATDDFPLTRLFNWENFLPARRPRAANRLATAAGFEASPAAKPSPDAQPADFISREVDPILDKISAHGIHSLTAREREILEQARAHMAKKN